LSCQKEAETVPETILAKVADRTISVNEFIRRAEYTIRPKYCRGNNYIYRKIVLNSLIAEKLLALDAGEENELIRNKEFQLYLQGRKEQAMRQWLYKKVAEDKVKLDEKEIQRVFKLAGRKYKVSFLTFPDRALAEQIAGEIRRGALSFDDFYRRVTGDSLAKQREIAFQTPEPDEVNEALYSRNIKKGEILGPLEIDSQSYLVIRVDGWVDRPAISDRQVRDRLKTVTEKLKQRRALNIFRKYVHTLMAGKTLKFNEPVFRALVEALGPEYYKTNKDKREAFNQKFWNKDRQEMVLDDYSSKIDHIRHQIFFTVGDQEWTVDDFFRQIKIHPLVFRKKHFPKKEFARHFKRAVVDLVRDQYITKDAYERGYDKVNLVQRNVQMWRDNLLALFQKKKILESADAKGKNTEAIIKEYLDPYLQNLRQSFNDQIFINTDAFEKIQLTNIDMFVIQPQAAFPVIVPSFPQLTMHDKLDYGQKLK